MLLQHYPPLYNSCLYYFVTWFRIVEQRRSALVIQEQIAERQHSRVIERERKEQDAQAMLARIREIEAKVQIELYWFCYTVFYSEQCVFNQSLVNTSSQEEDERQNKVVIGKKLFLEVMEANHNQTTEKERKRQINIEEDRRIAAYIAYGNTRHLII